MKKFTSLLLAGCLLFSMTACSQKPAEEGTTSTATTGNMTAGTYTVETRGMHEGLIIDVTVSEDKIEDIKVVESHETKGICDEALTTLPQLIIDNQSVNVDAMSGATISSNAVLRAVKDAIEQAGGDVNNFNEKVVASVKDAELTNDPLPTEWDMTYDVVVVGGGFAGLAASERAQSAGAKTVLVEKNAKVGGISATNGGQYAAYTSDRAAEIHEKQGTEMDTAEKHIEDTINGGDGLPQKELVEIMVNGSPIYFNHLLDNGLVIRDVIARPGGHYGYRTYVTENSIGADITQLQEKLARDAGVDIQVNSKLVQIFKDGDTVVGIQVATLDGLKTIKAEKGVILATGGFSSNTEMRQEYDPSLTPDLPTTNNGSTTGEGLRMAMDLGAGVTGMEWIQQYPWADPNTGILDTVAVMPFTGPSYGVVYVDVDGNRYVNEGERRDVCAKAAIATGATTTFSILNHDIASQWVPESDLEAGIASGRIIVGETLDELVENINAQKYKGAEVSMSADTLKATIETHNSYIDSKEDPDFNKVMADTMIKIENGPFYAIPQWPSVHHTMGGLTINTNAQVLDTEGNVIPGLFAAGEITGGIHGTNRLGSNADADACTFGMVAGTYAATGTNPVNVE
ncbi:MAG: flavocytochrome c [Erysipelotrichaceae bacterium]|nr:flavocytochrome c [Erysipelotrichaceae bacterium]MDY5251417.1 flavocytochrome c [Erysipelotrichaceae bacterium]